MPMRHLAFATLAALAGLASACATAAPGGALGGAGRDTAEIHDQLFKLQKDTARLLKAVEESRAAPGGAAAASCADAAERVENLELQIHAIQEQIAATQRRLDEVLVALRTMRGTPSSAWEGNAGGFGAGSVPQAPEAGPAAAGAAEPPAAEAPAGGSPTDLFNGAYADYSRGKFELALAGFEAALRADPSGPLADDAQYWIGETLYAMGRYREAADAFDAVITRYPEEDKLPAAHLKKGLALFEARETAAGVGELQYVIETWPDSDEARIAREYFKRKGIVAE
ncbi:MAG: outer membrane protein assembly factor BamD [Acidobacteria bacterium]|nr:MAG: outer membrane protein assembly factor BamD [Acidobacteriota bacterium]